MKIRELINDLNNMVVANPGRITLDTEVFVGSYYRDLPLDCLVREGAGRHLYPLLLIDGWRDRPLEQF